MAPRTAKTEAAETPEPTRLVGPGDDLAGNRPVEAKQPEAPSVRAATPETMAEKGISNARIQLERERRMYVRRNGGFRKHMHPDDMKKGEEICAKYGRPAEQGWDPAVFIPGYDNVSHEANQRKKGGEK